MAEALLDFEVADLRRDLRRIQGRGAENLFAALSRIRQTREAEARALETAVTELERRFDPTALHKIRIRARRLRYIAEVDAAIKNVPSEAPARFKELQSHLGRIQDAQVLSQWLGGLARRCDSRGPAALAAAARRRQAQFQALTRRYHQEKSLTEMVKRALDSLRRRDSDVA
jgi:CHAD domain-containing protein